jgi:hypothetical protein
MQAASAGRFQVCLLLLSAGADADLADSDGNTVLDLLFYLKHSHLRAHQVASAGYSCMDLYGMVNQYGLGGLLSAELREDCRDCGTCSYLLASVPELGDSDSEAGIIDDDDDGDSEEADLAGEDDDQVQSMRVSMSASASGRPAEAQERTAAASERAWRSWILRWHACACAEPRYAWLFRERQRHQPRSRAHF